MSRRPLPVPARLSALRDRFERWRQLPARPRRIPEALWDAAVAAAREHGTQATARVLRLNSDSLKRRVGQSAKSKRAQRQEAPPAFVELAVSAAAAGNEYVLELEERGSKLRLHVKGSAPDVAAVVAAFGSDRR